MIYLGITGCVNGNVTHDASACLIEDNKILAIAEEERFVRFKHSFNLFPTYSIKYCLNHAGISLKDVDKIGYYSDPKAYKLFYWKNLKRNIVVLRLKHDFKKIYEKLHFHFGFRPKKVHFVEHSLCHAYSSFPLSGFKNNMCFSIEAGGEETSTAVLKGGKTIKSFPLSNSLGWMYTEATEWLGFERNEGEGKTMGLAPYSNNFLDWSDVISFNINGEYKIKKNIYNYLVKKYGNRRYGEIQQVHKDVAATVQYYLEKAVLNMLEYYRPKKLTMAGGVGLNCKMNGALLASGIIDDIFITPMANDGGCSLGAAVYLAIEDGFKFKPLTHICYGPGFTDEEIKKVLDRNMLSYEYHDDIAGITAELLAKGKIVGWFQGRMEAGPRALGNRSILADPRIAGMKDRINNFVKHREPWRPYCPSIIDKFRNKYFETDYPSPFMILSFKVKEEKIKEIPAVVHVDGTTRPQTVTKKQNPLYYSLLDNFRKETGVPILLNTSFNIRGQPIVCSPTDALAMFFSEGMDALAIGNYLLKK